MCGRYTLYTEEENIELKGIMEEINRKLAGEPVSLPSGEVFPSQQAPALTAQGPVLLRWGFPRPGGAPLINARREGVLTSPLFKASFLARPCALPAAGFFEWRGPKNAREKLLFTVEETPLFYLAGFYSPQGEFTVLTREANAFMLPYHPRMPLLLLSGQVESYLREPDFIPPPPLLRVKAA